MAVTEDRAEDAIEQGGGGNAVGVVVAEDADMLAVFERAGGAGEGIAHVGHQGRIERVRLVATEERMGRFRRPDATTVEERGDQAVWME